MGGYGPHREPPNPLTLALTERRQEILAHRKRMVVVKLLEARQLLHSVGHRRIANTEAATKHELFQAQEIVRKISDVLGGK
jgi:hypothetical protein